MKKKKKKVSGLTLYVIFSFTCLIAYTIVSQFLAYHDKVELGALTPCFFAAFGGEVLISAIIKIFKLKGDNKDGSDSVDDGLDLGAPDSKLGNDGTSN